MSKPTPDNNKTRITELDGVRGIAIALVLVWHYVQNQINPMAGTYLFDIKNLLVFTWSGVDLFFVLSGFLIGGILLDNRDSENYFKTFYIRRACRIFPIYYLFILILVLATHLGIQGYPSIAWVFDLKNMPLWSYATFTQNILMVINNEAGPPWLNVTWSLAVEEHFYLFLPLIVRYVKKDQLPIVLLWFIISAPLLRATAPGLSAYINAPWRADSLLLGVLLAYGVRTPGFWEAAEKYRYVIYSAFSGLVIIVGIMALNTLLKLGGAITHLVYAGLYTLLLLIILMSQNGLLSRFLRMRILVWLGTISYGVYLLHQGMSSVLHGLIRLDYPAMVDLKSIGVTLLALALTLLISHISYYYFEKRIIRFSHAFKYGRQ